MSMISRRWLVVFVLVVLGAAGIAVVRLTLPEVIRQMALARIQALTDRPASIERVEVHLVAGHITVRGFRLAERAGQAPFADFERLDVRIHLPALLRGDLRIRELLLRNSTVRVVRLPTNEFNFSDLIRSTGTTRQALEVTVDHFALTGGTVTLEDRALPESRTWASENITIEARNISTRRDDGWAVATSILAGAPVSVEVQRLRLAPIHLQATVSIEGLDLALARLYTPPDALVTLDRGQATTEVQIALDARQGLQVEATARFNDIVLVRGRQRERVAVLPAVTTQVAGLSIGDDGLRLARLQIAGSGTILDPSVPQAGRLENVRASISGLT